MRSYGFVAEVTFKALISLLIFSSYLMAYLMTISVTLLSMLMILVFTLHVIRSLIYDNILEGGTLVQTSLDAQLCLGAQS